MDRSINNSLQLNEQFKKLGFYRLFKGCRSHDAGADA